MNSRNRKILDAARAVFSRYGIAKTTMNDIAREAGVARQTLYNAYPGRDEVLRAMVRDWLDHNYGEITKAWETTDDLGSKFDIFFDLGPIAWFDHIHASPESADMIEGFHQVTREEKSVFRKRASKRMATEFAKYSDVLQDRGITADQISDFFYTAAVNAKYDADSREDLINRLASLRAATLALLDEL